MRVRIRFGRGARIAHKPHEKRHVAAAVGSLLTPAAVGASILGLWRIAADLKWTSEFAIPNGFFSHWQVWLAAAALLQLCSHLLGRYGVPHGSNGDGGA